MGDELSPRGGSLRPLAQSRGGGGGDSAWGGHGSARQSVREATRAAEAPARIMEVTGGAAVAMSTAATTPAESPRKRKRGFSTLR
jgi:hypothetical protein